MRIYHTSDPLPSSLTDQHHIYNGKDCCVTLEVLHAIKPKLDEITEPIYEQAINLQAPILEMECRGVYVDQERRDAAIGILAARLAELEDSLAAILNEGLGLGIPWPPTKKSEESRFWNSPKKLLDLFYGKMNLPVIKKRTTVGMVPTVDRKALEKIRGYFFAEPIVNHVLAIRDTNKRLGVLRTGIDSDGRIRTSYNIAGTDTGRLNSYESATGSGTNLQNITGELRYIYAADPGYKLCYIDLEQAESRAVGAIIWNLFHDGAYLDACESADLHTTVCKLCWPELPWTGEAKADKAIAKQPFYRHFDYRDASKRLGHATNYHGQPFQIAQEVRIPRALVEAFQPKYFAAFPGIPEWHGWTKKKLLTDGWITSIMGRRRWFFGRRWDNDTLNAAIAYNPQSAVADYIDRGLLNVWRENIVQLLLQVHDAIVFQYPIHLENEVVPRVQRLLEIEVPLMYGRSLVIPTEAMVGFNWGYTTNAKKELVNPDGLVPFTGNDNRKRTAPVGLLDRRFHEVARRV